MITNPKNMCISWLHLWQVYLSLFLETTKVRNNHKLKVVSINAGIKKWGMCKCRKAELGNILRKKMVVKEGEHY